MKIQKIQLKDTIDKILLLGAGASVEYGLPIWKDLSQLIIEEIKADENDSYHYRKEIVEWLEKVGDGKTYDTIDSCIRYESISNKYQDGDEIENELFTIIRKIFDKKYTGNENGWIKILNEKILNDENEFLEQNIVFVNFNYDDVLEKNFLNLSLLHKKQKRYTYKDRLLSLSEAKVHALYPHGKFSVNQNPESHILIRKQTMKSEEGVHLDVVSCYESDKYTIYKQEGSFELYIMGLGGGLGINLNNINFPNNSISVIHITIKDETIKDDVVKFLVEKYIDDEPEIIIYSSCEELVNKCFNN